MDEKGPRAYTGAVWPQAVETVAETDDTAACDAVANGETPSHDETPRTVSAATRRFGSWLGTDAGRNTLYAVVPPVLVTGCANLAAHQLYTPEAGLSAAAVALGTGYLGVKGLAHRWSPAATYTFLGMSAVTVNTGVVVACGGWVDVIAAALFGAASLGGRLAFLHGTAEKRARARGEAAKAQLIEAKTQLTLLKAQSETLSIGLKHAKATASTKVAEYTPNLAGRTPEETAIRTAFWNIHKAELMGCEVQYTRTGYTAVVGLPTQLSRDSVRQGWDYIGSALRARGRFVLANSHFTNELNVKFLDAGKSDTTDVSWRPELISDDPALMSVGVNTETGETVLMQADERTLVCGGSGSGKSWSLRPMMAHAHHHGSLVFIDGKGEESTVVGDVARVANDFDDIEDLIDELHEEMNRRKGLMKDQRVSVWKGEQLTVVVDEGQVVLSLLGANKKSGAARTQRLRELSSLGRSRGVVMWWSTQKPTMSGSAPGVDTMISPNLIQRFSLRVADGQEARTALDDCAHYGPHLIPDDKGMRGHGYLKGFGPSLIRSWTMDDDSFRALPRKVWSMPAPESDSDKIVRYFIENPSSSNMKAANAFGFSESKVRRLRKVNGSH